MVDVTHGFHVFKDGGAWCAVGPHFIDLQLSPAGFGDTPDAAVKELHKEFGKDRWWDNKVYPDLSKFTVHAYQNCDRNDRCEEGIGVCYCQEDPAVGDLRS